MGFAPRHYFSSLVFARLFLYFFHSYYFFVAITRKEIHSHSKDENGIPRQIFATANRRTTSLGGKSGIRSATLFLFTCFRSTLLILLSFLLFLCRYHAGVANNRFIGCLVGSFSLKTQALLYEPTPNPFESPFSNVKTKRTGKFLPVRFVWRKRGDSNP